MKPSQDDPALLPIEAVNFTIRTERMLSELKIKLLGDLQQYTAFELIRKPGYGRRTIRELRKVLAYHGLKFKGDYVCDNDEEKRLIQDIPVQIKEIYTDLKSLEKRIGFLCNKLDELHFNMQPLKDEVK